MNPKIYLISLFVVMFLVGGVIMTRNQLFLPRRNLTNDTLGDSSFGWKFPIEKFPSGQVTESGAYSELRKTGGSPRGLPVRLLIPIIGVDSVIEDAYITPDGRMDVPAGSKNVAWFAIGTIPGQKGSAVIGGHFGIDNGEPKVFYDLNKLVAGDKIFIIDDFDNTLAFIVRSIRLFDRNADATSVFYSNDGLAHLNVITCEGEWNRVEDSYPDRRVVFTDSIPWEEPVRDVKTKPIETKINPSLPQTDDTIDPKTQEEQTFFQKIVFMLINSIKNLRK
jgi:hypothetical protein